MDVNGSGIIMSDVAIIFKSEGFYDDTLTIQVTAADLSRVGCDIYYHILNKESGKEIAQAKTGIVFYDYKNRKVNEVPKIFVKAVTKNL